MAIQHKKILPGLLIPVLSALALTGCAGSGEESPQKLTILHTNDHHGRFWENEHGEYGMAARKTLIDQIRAEVEATGGEVLLLSGGDINTGVPESDMQHAEPDFKGMNHIGYDAMAIGNHEFDNSLEILAKQQNWAEFPMLSANIYYEATGERAFQPYAMFERQGLNIAVIGLTTEGTAWLANPDNTAGLEFREAQAEAEKVIEEVERDQDPDLIIAATHMGHYDDGNHGVNAPGDVLLARSLKEGKLDMIIGGHSQQPVCMESENVTISNYTVGGECVPDQQNGTWIMQAHEWGKYVGRADFEVIDGELELVSYNLIPVNLKQKVKLEDGSSHRVLIGEEIPHDAALKAFLQPYQEKGQQQLGVVIGYTDGRLMGERGVVRNQQTNLGRLIATTHMEIANADFAVMNSGGVRASIEAGEITYKDVLTVQPFANMITKNTMSGAEVQEYLNALATKTQGSGAFAQFAGISMTIDFDRGRASDVMIGGKPLDPFATYSFTVPGFNANGGDGYPKISHLPGFVDTGYVDADALKSYIEQNSPLRIRDFEPQGEIRYR